MWTEFWQKLADMKDWKLWATWIVCSKQQPAEMITLIRQSDRKRKKGFSLILCLYQKVKQNKLKGKALLEKEVRRIT